MRVKYIFTQTPNNIKFYVSFLQKKSKPHRIQYKIKFSHHKSAHIKRVKLWNTLKTHLVVIIKSLYLVWIVNVETSINQYAFKKKKCILLIAFQK